MVTVSLNGAEFFAYHGFYPEEQLIGGYYIIDISVAFKPANELAADELNNTVNYEALYNICCIEMKQPRKLLETVAGSIMDKAKEQFNFAEVIDITLKKKNPPMGGLINHSAVRITYKREANIN